MHGDIDKLSLVVGFRTGRRLIPIQARAVYRCFDFLFEGGHTKGPQRVLCQRCGEVVTLILKKGGSHFAATRLKPRDEKQAGEKHASKRGFENQNPTKVSSPKFAVEHCREPKDRPSFHHLSKTYIFIWARFPVKKKRKKQKLGLPVRGRKRKGHTHLLFLGFPVPPSEPPWAVQKSPAPRPGPRARPASCGWVRRDAERGKRKEPRRNETWEALKRLASFWRVVCFFFQLQIRFQGKRS